MLLIIKQRTPNIEKTTASMYGVENPCPGLGNAQLWGGDNQLFGQHSWIPS